MFAAIGAANAHRPLLVKGERIKVVDPHISWAFYNKLSGKKHEYVVNLKDDEQVYVGILLPYLSDSQSLVSARIVNEAGIEIAKLDGKRFAWKIFYESYANDTYWYGPEFRKRLRQGTYTVEVFSEKNEEKYALAIGEVESFPPLAIYETLRVVPQIKREIFEKSPADFLFSIFGVSYIVIVYLVALLGTLTYRALARRLSNKRRLCTFFLSRIEKMVILVAGFSLLSFAIFTSWHPLLLFVSGILVFLSSLSTLKSHCHFTRSHSALQNPRV